MLFSRVHWLVQIRRTYVRTSFRQVIAADGEKQASRALKEAAMVMNENPSALQLRYLQTLSVVATERESTIYFPLPMNTLGGVS